MSFSHVIMFFFRPVITVILFGCQKSEPVAQEGEKICTDQSGRMVASRIEAFIAPVKCCSSSGI